MYSMSRLTTMSRVGNEAPARPPRTPAATRMISNRKHRPIVAISVMTSASSKRTPRFWSESSSSTSSPVMSTPIGSGRSEQQVERDRRSDHLGEVARGDGDLAEHPEPDGDRPRIVVAARLREIASGDDAELGREPLQQHRHEVREQDDAEQRVPELRSAGEIGGPVAGVHVADGDEIPGPGEREQLAEEAGPDRNGAIDLLQARRDARPPPPATRGVRWAVSVGHVGRGRSSDRISRSAIGS